MTSASSSFDAGPLRWALGVIVAMVAVWLAFSFMGDQRYHNTELWQRWRPIVARSEPQTAQPVEVRDQWRNALAVVQTEKGLYFLSGTKHVPAANAQVRVEVNERWELYLCQTANAHCMTIHSFCAGATWPKVARDAKGQAEGCHAPYLGRRSAEDLKKPPPPPQLRAGPGKRFNAPPPPAGMSHPSEWAHLMGLPVAPRALEVSGNS